jgi:hypothetical protein
VTSVQNITEFDLCGLLTFFHANYAFTRKQKCKNSLLLFLVRRSLCSNIPIYCICIVITCAFCIIVFFHKMDLTNIMWEGVDWLHLSQDRNWWQALVNTVMNIQFHKSHGISCLSDYQLLKKDSTSWS